mgnify:CR=1 FL=1
MRETEGVRYQFTKTDGTLDEKEVLDRLASRNIRVLNHHIQEYSPTMGMLCVIVEAAVVVYIHPDDNFLMGRYNEIVPGYHMQRK